MGHVARKQMVTAIFHFAPQSLWNVGLSYFSRDPVTPNARVRISTGSLIDRWQMSGGLLQSTFAVTHVGVRIFSKGQDPMILSPNGNLGNYYGQSDRSASRYQWLEEWSPRMFRFSGTH